MWILRDATIKIFRMSWDSGLGSRKLCFVRLNSIPTMAKIKLSGVETWGRCMERTKY